MLEKNILDKIADFLNPSALGKHPVNRSIWDAPNMILRLKKKKFTLLMMNR